MIRLAVKLQAEYADIASMETRDIELLEQLVLLRSLLREAEASTEDLSTKLRFSHDEADGWPVLRLKAVVTDNPQAPQLKIAANDKGEVILRSSLQESPITVAFKDDAAADKLRNAVGSLVTEMLENLKGPPGGKPLIDAADGEEPDELFTNDVPEGELFESVEAVADEEIDALPEI